MGAVEETGAGHAARGYGNALVGIFVGGQSRRMGGAPKGLLRAPDSDETLVVRLLGIAREALPGADVVLVGRADAYAALGLPALADSPAGIGPLGGLAALLTHAAARDASQAFAVACDLPFVGAKLLGRLASEAPAAPAAAFRVGGIWQPLFARYEPRATLSATRAALAAGNRSLQSVLSRLDVVELALDETQSRELADWDTPEDRARCDSICK